MSRGKESGTKSSNSQTNRAINMSGYPEVKTAQERKKRAAEKRQESRKKNPPRKNSKSRKSVEKVDIRTFLEEEYDESGRRKKSPIVRAIEGLPLSHGLKDWLIGTLLPAAKEYKKVISGIGIFRNSSRKEKKRALKLFLKGLAFPFEASHARLRERYTKKEALKESALEGTEGVIATSNTQEKQTPNSKEPRGLLASIHYPVRNNGGKNKKLIVIFHGNKDSAIHSMRIAKMQFPGHPILAIQASYSRKNSCLDDRNVQSLDKDAENALKLVDELGYSRSNVVAYGASLGGVTASMMAEKAESEKKPLAGLIMNSNFTSIPDILGLNQKQENTKRQKIEERMKDKALAFLIKKVGEEVANEVLDEIDPKIGDGEESVRLSNNERRLKSLEKTPVIVMSVKNDPVTPNHMQERLFYSSNKSIHIQFPIMDKNIEGHIFQRGFGKDFLLDDLLDCAKEAGGELEGLTPEEAKTEKSQFIIEPNVKKCDNNNILDEKVEVENDLSRKIKKLKYYLKQKAKPPCEEVIKFFTFREGESPNLRNMKGFKEKDIYGLHVGGFVDTRIIQAVWPKDNLNAVYFPDRDSNKKDRITAIENSISDTAFNLENNKKRVLIPINVKNQHSFTLAMDIEYEAATEGEGETVAGNRKIKNVKAKIIDSLSRGSRSSKSVLTELNANINAAINKINKPDEAEEEQQTFVNIEDGDIIFLDANGNNSCTLATLAVMRTLADDSKRDAPIENLSKEAFGDFASPDKAEKIYSQARSYLKNQMHSDPFKRVGKSFDKNNIKLFLSCEWLDVKAFQTVVKSAVEFGKENGITPSNKGDYSWLAKSAGSIEAVIENVKGNKESKGREIKDFCKVLNSIGVDKLKTRYHKTICNNSDVLNGEALKKAAAKVARHAKKNILCYEGASATTPAHRESKTSQKKKRVSVR